MNKELAYTKGDPGMSVVQISGIETPDGWDWYYCKQTLPVESLQEAQGNCKLFNQSPAMYEKWLKFLEMHENDAPGYAYDDLYNEVREIIKKIES